MDPTSSRFSSTLRYALGAKGGDESSWARLESKVRPWIESDVATEKWPGTMDQDDIVQAVLFELFRTFDRLEFHSREEFRSFVRSVTMHKVTDLWRHARARKRGRGRFAALDSDGEELGIEPIDPAGGPSTIARHTEMDNRIEAALSVMPLKEREVLLLRETQGLSYEEIAVLLKFEKSETVRKRCVRARKHRRELLEKLAEEMLIESPSVSNGQNGGPIANEPSSEPGFREEGDGSEVDVLPGNSCPPT